MVFELKKGREFKKVLPHRYHTKPCYQMTTLLRTLSLQFIYLGFFRLVLRFSGGGGDRELSLSAWNHPAPLDVFSS